MGCNECVMALQQKQCAFDVEGGSLSKFVGTAIPRQGCELWADSVPPVWTQPKATKYKPAWRCGAWLGKDIADHDLTSTDGQFIMRTKAVRKISNQWDAELFLGMTDGPVDFFGHRQVKSKQKIIPLSAPPAEVIDDEAETLQDQVLSDGYSASEPLDVEDAEGRQDPMEA
jgi:hypothetical protein